MPSLLTFQQRLDAEAKAEYVPLSDGSYRRLRMGFTEQPLAAIVRIADLSNRIESLGEESPLLYTHIVELARLMFEDDLPFDVVANETPDTLMGIVMLALGGQEESRDDGKEMDLGMALMSAAADGADPLAVWETWPSWLLSVAVDGRDRLRAIDAIEHATAVQLGSGNFKNRSDATRIQNDWRRRVRGGTSAMPETAQGFAAMMASMGMPVEIIRREG